MFTISLPIAEAIEIIYGVDYRDHAYLHEERFY